MQASLRLWRPVAPRPSGFASVRQTVLAFLAICLVPSLLLAQAAATGTIAGRVENGSTGHYLDKAHVTVDGTNIEALTNQFGEYRLEGVPAGPAKVKVFYTGLEAQESLVTVSGGSTTESNFTLNPAGQENKPGSGPLVLDAFVVAARKDTDQRSIAVNEQRFAPNLKTVVATDQFGDITEGNIGEFVKFLPGISVGYTASDVRNISVRGVGSQ